MVHLRWLPESTVSRLVSDVLRQIQISIKRNDTKAFREFQDVFSEVENARLMFDRSSNSEFASASHLLTLKLLFVQSEFSNALQRCHIKFDQSTESLFEALSVTSKSGFSCFDALSMLIEGLKAYQDQSISNLRNVIPKQTATAIQFEIIDDQIVVAKPDNLSLPADQKNIDSARSELLTQGREILNELESSNIDPRLIRSVKQLHTQIIETEINPIKIGLININCEAVCNAVDSELAPALAAMLRAYTRSVQMLIAQFPDWVRFIQNVASADIVESDMKEFGHRVRDFIAGLINKPDIVSPEVPRVLVLLSEMLNRPEAAKKAAFALIRSMENLVSVVYNHGTDFLEKTAEKTKETASSAASRVIVGLLLVGLASAFAVGPAAEKFPDMKWLKVATSIIEKQLSKIMKD